MESSKRMLYLACWCFIYKSLPSPQHMTTAAADWGLNKLFTNDNYCLFGYPFDTLALASPPPPPESHVIINV